MVMVVKGCKSCLRWWGRGGGDAIRHPMQVGDEGGVAATVGDDDGGADCRHWSNASPSATLCR